MDKLKIIIGLVILLAIAVSYIVGQAVSYIVGQAVSYIVGQGYTKIKQQEQLAVFEEGTQYGYEQAIIQIVRQAVTCQQVPLTVQNQTINLIAIDCLQEQ